MKRALVVVALALFATSARADDEAPGEETDPVALFRQGTAAIAAQRPGEAIAKLEALGDRGVTDPVVSYDRGLAYAARVRAGGEQPGDLGRAVHGFEEARELTRDATLAADATNALTIVRSEIARRRARSGDPIEIEHGFSLGRSIVDLLPENAWATLAGAFALALSIAIVARRLATRTRAKVAATTSGAIAGGLLLLTSVLTWAARDARLHLHEAIVVTPGARLLDLRHLVIDGALPIPEGVRVRVREEAAGYSLVVVVGAEGYLPSSAVLPIAKRASIGP